MPNIVTRIESKSDVQCFLANLKYALDHNAKVTFQENRQVDLVRDIKHTNRFTVVDLFPNEDPVSAIKREVRKLTVEEYMKTVKDLRFKKRSEMREFGKVYNGDKDVYIKIRVDLLSECGDHSVFIMSFHYADTPFSDSMFPYKEREV